MRKSIGLIDFQVVETWRIAQAWHLGSFRDGHAMHRALRERVIFNRDAEDAGVVRIETQGFEDVASEERVVIGLRGCLCSGELIGAVEKLVQRLGAALGSGRDRAALKAEKIVADVGVCSCPVRPRSEARHSRARRLVTAGARLAAIVLSSQARTLAGGNAGRDCPLPGRS